MFEYLYPHKEKKAKIISRSIKFHIKYMGIFFNKPFDAATVLYSMYQV